LVATAKGYDPSIEWLNHRLGNGFWGGRCLSLGDYVMGAHEGRERFRSVLMLPTLRECW